VIFKNQYTWIDRLLHQVGFNTGQLQISIADIEEIIFAKRLESVQINRPVFVTALPRAGTTILLNILVNSGEFASHTYRDMPFVICPMFWQSFSRHFYKMDIEQERAHGDGLTISAGSPEALEEIIWKIFWSKHYKHGQIKPWEEINDPVFIDFMRDHVRKIVAIRSDDIAQNSLRYISKNNLNIARLRCMRKIFPDCIIIIPFREPLQHAASLLKQHIRFLDMHKKDKFSQKYMKAIGHYDFGENHRPINFDNWLSGNNESDPLMLSYWIKYWIACYRHIISMRANHIHMISYSNLIERPSEALEKLNSVIQLEDSSLLLGQASSLKVPKIHTNSVSDIPENLLETANELYRELIHLSEDVG